MKILLISEHFEPSNSSASNRWSEFFEVSKNFSDDELTVLTTNWTGKKLNADRIIRLGNEKTFCPPKSVFPTNNHRFK